MPVWIAKPLDYEEQNIYKMQVRATDVNGLWYLINYVVNILDVNEAPTILVKLIDLHGCVTEQIKTCI